MGADGVEKVDHCGSEAFVGDAGSLRNSLAEKRKQSCKIGGWSKVMSLAFQVILDGAEYCSCLGAG